MCTRLTVAFQIGPRKWIAGQVFAFGLVATLQVFLRDRGGFLASRLMLGLAEAGYIPGAIYTLSTWYRKRELAKRVAILFFGMFGGNAMSPLLASGILKLEGHHGLRGWQWLFLLEGIFTMTVSLVLLFLLPGSPDSPRPLLSPGAIHFSEGEQKILQRRLEVDDSEKRQGAQGMHIPWKLVWKTLSHYRRWPHFVSTFAAFSTWSPLTTYTPSIIMRVGPLPVNQHPKMLTPHRQGPWFRPHRCQRSRSRWCVARPRRRLHLCLHQRQDEQTRL